MRIFKTTTSIKDDGEDEDEPVKKSIFATCPVEKKRKARPICTQDTLPYNSSSRYL